MTDAMQRCEGGVDDSSAGSPSSVSDETDPAGVVLEARVVQARVTQGRYPTLSVRPVPRHGRLQPKGTRPVVPSAQVGARRSGATDNRSAPASISPPPSPPWTREARRVPSVMVMLALAFGSVKTFGLCKCHEPPRMRQTFGTGDTVPIADGGALLLRQSQFRSRQRWTRRRALTDGRE